MYTSEARIRHRRVVLTAAFLLAMAASHIVLFVRLLPQLRSGYQDFVIFYSAGTMIRGGHAAQLYDPQAQWEMQRKFAPNVTARRAALPYNHPPFEALFFAPLTRLDFFSAYVVWTLLNLALLAATLRVMWIGWGPTDVLAWPLALLGAAGFFPAAMTVVQGQDSVLLLFLSVLGVAALSRGEDVAAGTILALGLFKFHLMLPLALVLAVRRPRLLAGFVPSALLLAATSVATVGWSGALQYVRFVFVAESQGTVSGITASQMPSLHGLLASLVGSVSAAMALTAVASIAILTLAMRRARQPQTSLARLYALAAATAVLVGFHTLQHDLSLLLPAGLLLLAHALGRDPASLRDWLLPAALFCTPLYLALGMAWDHLSLFALVVLWLFAALWREEIGPWRRHDPPPQSATAEGV